MTNAFGRAIATHRGAFTAGGWLWYVGGILIASGVLPLVSGTMPMVEALGAAALACSIGGLLVLVAAMRWRQSLVLYERGLVLTRLLRPTVTIDAGDVASVEHWTAHGSAGAHSTAVVHRKSGRTLEMSHLHGSDQIVAIVRSWTRPSAPQVSWQPHDGAR
jgi:hypothetical protein